MDNHTENLLQASERSHRVPEISAGIAAGIALLALFGWVSGARVLAGQFGTYIPMAPSIALAFLLLGGALFCFAHVVDYVRGAFAHLTWPGKVLPPRNGRRSPERYKNERYPVSKSSNRGQGCKKTAETRLVFAFDDESVWG